MCESTSVCATDKKIDFGFIFSILGHFMRETPSQEQEVTAMLQRVTGLQFLQARKFTGGNSVHFCARIERLEITFDEKDLVSDEALGKFLADQMPYLRSDATFLQERFRLLYMLIFAANVFEIGEKRLHKSPKCFADIRLFECTKETRARIESLAFQLPDKEFTSFYETILKTAKQILPGKECNE
jgi:hypothetical protein